MTTKPARLTPISPRKLVARILDEPQLIGAVQSLEPRVLGRLIDHVGLEDCGEIVALATTAQLERIFDDDLWRGARPGEDETFDADRFALWIEVMLEAGEAFTADKLAQLPEDLVTLALQRQVLVIDLDRMALQLGGAPAADRDWLEKALDSWLYLEIDQYRVISRQDERWDAIVAVLLALDRDHHDLLQRLLERCCSLCTEFIEDNGGLYNVLCSEQMLAADVAGEREDRRAIQGFVAPSAAASFFALARSTGLEQIAAAPRDPVTRAYFRQLAPALDRPGAGSTPSPSPDASPPDKLEGLLREAAVLEPLARPVGLLDGVAPGSPRSTPLEEALRQLGRRAPDLHRERREELAFLANVLVAGCSLAGRSLRPLEAARAAVAACNLGLEHLLGTAERRAAEALLEGEPCDRLFRLGWHLLHHEVQLPAGRALARALSSRAGDAPAGELARVANRVRQAVAAGKPWIVLGRLDELHDVLDPAIAAALRGLLDECPSLAGTLAEDGVSREPQFIATEAQRSRARAFLEDL